MSRHANVCVESPVARRQWRESTGARARFLGAAVIERYLSSFPLWLCSEKLNGNPSEKRSLARELPWPAQMIKSCSCSII